MTHRHTMINYYLTQYYYRWTHWVLNRCSVKVNITNTQHIHQIHNNNQSRKRFSFSREKYRFLAIFQPVNCSGFGWNYIEQTQAILSRSNSKCDCKFRKRPYRFCCFYLEMYIDFVGPTPRTTAQSPNIHIIVPRSWYNVYNRIKITSLHHFFLVY